MLQERKIRHAITVCTTISAFASLKEENISTHNNNFLSNSVMFIVLAVNIYSTGGKRNLACSDFPGILLPFSFQWLLMLPSRNTTNILFLLLSKYKLAEIHAIQQSC
jgi:hypothetical protein